MRKSYQLKDIIQIVDQVFSSNRHIEDAAKGFKVGDSFAEFLAQELIDTFDPKEPATIQIREVYKIVSRIADISNAIRDTLEKIITDLDSNIFVTNFPKENRSLYEKAIKESGMPLTIEYNACDMFGQRMDTHLALYSKQSDLTDFWKIYNLLKEAK